METSLLRYIWNNSRKDQLIGLLIILASMPTYFLSLELPKQIVNGPIQGVGFENPGDVANFMKITLPLPEFLYSGDPIVLFNGFDLERMGYLFTLSFAFLALVTANGLFKLFINTYKGRMGERLLRRLRFQLFDRVLRFPLARFRRTKASEISSMIKDEVEPMGEFIGDAYTMPLFEGGQALTALVFIFLQNFELGCLTIVIILFQAWLIPRLRRPIIVLGKRRQVEARHLSGRLGEVVEGISDMHVNDTSNRERSDISTILSRLFFIRFELYQMKFAVKFLNNFLLLFLQFLFYALGGYFAIRGTLDIGQLIAVIAAFKDLPGPVRGLINWDQKRLLVEARYSQIAEQFTVEDLTNPEIQAMPNARVPHIEKGFVVDSLGVEDDTGSKLLERVNVTIDKDQHVAIIGPVNGGAANFSETLVRVLAPTSGSIELDGQSLGSVPESLTGRRISYIDSNSYFPQGSIMDCMTYVLEHQPVNDVQRDAQAEAEHRKFLNEARRSLNSDLDIKASWIDFAELGIDGPEALVEHIRSLFRMIGIEEEIRGLGLRGSLNPEEHPELCEKFLKARHEFKNRLETLGFSAFVEPFEPDKYNNQSTLGENLLFGTATASAFETDKLASNVLVRKVLREHDLEQKLFEVGREVASTTVELFGGLSSDNPFFDQLDYMDADDIPLYRTALSRIGDHVISEVTEEDAQLILKLPFAYSETRNRLGLLTDDLKNKIVEVRGKLREVLSEMDAPPVAFYDPNAYNPAASVLDNVLLGRVASNVAEGPERVFEAISALMNEMQLNDEVFSIGMEFNVGTGGKRLSESLRQKIHLARALLKKPDIMVVNQALNTLDAGSQKHLLERVLQYSREEGRNFGVIWVPMNPSLSQSFERVLMFKDGELIADDTPSTLLATNDVYKELVA